VTRACHRHGSACLRRFGFWVEGFFRIVDLYARTGIGFKDYILRPAAGGCRGGQPDGIGYNAGMSKLLEKGIEAVRGLPTDRQDMAGELLLSLAKTEAQYRLTAEQLEDVKLAIAEADRGEFATDKDMAETWTKFGR
jgi:hypothetical protein